MGDRQQSRASSVGSRRGFVQFSWVQRWLLARRTRFPTTSRRTPTSRTTAPIRTAVSTLKPAPVLASTTVEVSAVGAVVHSFGVTGGAGYANARVGAISSPTAARASVAAILRTIVSTHLGELSDLRQTHRSHP